MRKFLVLFLNVSLKFDSDVITGRQNNKLEWVRDKKIRHVNPPIDCQILLLHGISEKSVISHEETILSEANTETAVGSARTHFPFLSTSKCPWRENCCLGGRRESGWSSGTACCWRSWRNWWRCGEGGRHHGWGCRRFLWCSRVGDVRVWVAGSQFLRGCPQKTTRETDFV